MRKQCLSTPKIHSITLRADAWRRLKSSSLFLGLKTMVDQNEMRKLEADEHTFDLLTPIQQDDSEHYDME
jgi:hypothetical protein